MRTIQEIEADIARVKEDLRDVHGTNTEVYARIVGYYRSVRNWNRGKREEYNHRKLFVAENKLIETHLPENMEKNTMPVNTDGSIAHYELFVRKTCPNCPPVKECCARLPFPGDQIDVDSDAGLERAQEFGVFSAPTVIFFDEAGREVSRAHSSREIHTQLPAAEGTLA